MAEVTLDLRHVPKPRAYAQLHAHGIAVLAGIDDDIAGMATMAALVHHAFRHLGRLLAVLDIDSTRRSAFDQEDVDGLERVTRWFAHESPG